MNLQERDLTEGLTGADVAELQNEFAQLGYSIPRDEQNAANFGPGTLSAVQQFQSSQNLPSNGTVDAETASALSRVIKASTYNVTGTVTSPTHAAVGTLTVQLTDQNVGGDQVLAKVETSSNGAYSFSTVISPDYLKKHNKTQPDLQVSILAGTTVLASSPVSYNAPMALVIDVVLPANAAGLPSEYETLSANLGLLYSGRLSDLQENAQQADITFLANKSGWDARMVAMAALADQFSQTTATAPNVTSIPGAPADAAPVDEPAHAAQPTVSLQPAFYYALFRAGVPANADQLFRVSSASASAIWTQAISQSVIPASLEREIPVATETFQTLAASHALTMKPAIGVSDLTDQVSTVLTTASQQSKFATLLTQSAGNWSELWTAAQTAFGQQTTSQLQVLGRLHYLTLNNAPVVAALLKAVPSIASSLEGLASSGFYDPVKWTPLIGNSLPPGLPGATTADQAANYAALLAAQVKLAFPTAVLSDQVTRGIMPIAGPSSVAREVASFLSANQDAFVIGVEPVEAFIARAKVAPPSTAVLGQIKRLQRVYQLTTSDNNMAVLLNHNMDSAYAITRYDSAGFARALGPQLGGAETAAAVHTRARQVFSAVLNLTASYAVSRRGPALGGTWKLVDNSSNPPPPSVLPSATLQELFGSLDYCNCSDCNSILSPAAYFVDLLHYLDQPSPTPNFSNPQTELFKRRPDLQYLALSCENTNTVLPYIDIVNETLEAFVAGNLSLDNYEGFNTSADITSACLIAAPQNINDAAYSTLQTSFFPAPLPFNRPLALLRQHMQALNVALPDAMIALRASDAVTNSNTSAPASYVWSDILIEQLGLSRDEYRLFTDPTLELGDLYGLPRASGQTTAQWNATTLATLQTMTVQEYSACTGVDYTDLVAILETRFINPGCALIERVEVLGVGFAAIQELHNDPSANAAAFIAALPAGLDYSQYGGTSGQAVVNWLTGQNYDAIMGLITITNPSGGTDDCSGSALQFRYANPDTTSNSLTATDFLKLIRFIRLWSKLQSLLQIGDDSDAISATDALLCALYPQVDLPQDSDNAANDSTNRPLLDTGFTAALLRAGFVVEVMNRLSLDWTSLTQLLACWADIDTTGSQSLYASMFLTPTLLQQDPGAQAATVSPAVNTGDKLTTTIDTVPIAAYTVAAGDTAQSVATRIASAINTTITVDPVSGKPLNQRFHAAAEGPQVVITAGFAIQWQASASGSSTLNPAALTDPTVQSATVEGTPAAGHAFNVTIDTIPISYVAQDSDTSDNVAAGLAAVINATTALHPYSGLPLNSLLAASAAGAVVTIRTADAGPPFDLACSIKLANTATYTVGPAVPAEVVVTLSGTTTAGDVVTLTLNTVGVPYTVAANDSSLSILAANLANAFNGAVQTDPTTTLPFSALLHATSNGATLTITPLDPSTSLTVTVSSNVNGSEQFAVAGPTPASQPAKVSGTFPPGSVLATTINGADLLYTVVPGDTANTVASGIVSALKMTSVLDPSTGVALNTLVSASASGGTVTVTAANTTTTFTLAVSASQGTYTAGRLNPPFADNGYGVYLDDPTQTLLVHQPLLCAACKLSGAEFALIIADLGFDATTPLTLDNVSAVFRRGWLAHALGLSVAEFLALRRFSGLDPFAPLDPSVAAPAEPPAIRFLRLEQAMQNARLAPVQALYLLWNQDQSGTLAPDFDSVAGLAQALRADFVVVESQFALQDDPDGSIAKQLMALVYGAADTDFFFGLLNQTFTVSVPCNYASSVLPQPVLDASGGLLDYDGTAKTLSVTQVLTNAAAAAIAAAAQVSTTDKTDNVAAGQVTLTPVSMTRIAAGAALVIDSGAAAETVVVKSAAITSFTTTTALSHNGTATPFPIVNDPSLPAALTALAAASQQAVLPFFEKYPELEPLYNAYMASSAPVQSRRQTLLANFLPTLIRRRKVEQALAAITAQIGCDPGFAPALLQDAVIVHADTDATQPAVADLTGIEAGGLSAAYFPGNDPTQSPDQSSPAVGPVAYTQTATLGGTPAVGEVTTSINGQPIPCAVTAADTALDELASQVAATINACSTVDPISRLPINALVTASASGSSVLLTPSQPLTSTSVFNLMCASTVSGLTYTAGSQLPSGSGGGGIAGTWSGFVTVPQTGNYDICVVADPGAAATLTINDADVSMALVNGILQNQTSIALSAGQLISIALTVRSLKTTLALGWRSPPGLGWTLIPAPALFAASAMDSLGATYTRFLKAVSLATTLSLTADEITWLGTDTTQTVGTTCTGVTTPGPASFSPGSMVNIAIGSSLIVDSGPAQETVTVIAPTTLTSFTAVTTKAHDGATTAFPIVSVPKTVLNDGWLNSLPGVPDADPVNDPVPNLSTAAQLTLVLAAVLDFARMKQALSRSDERVLEVLQNPEALLPNGQSALLSLTGWAQVSVNALSARFFGDGSFSHLATVENFARVFDAMTLVQNCRITAPALLAAATNAPSPTTVSGLQSALRAFYSADDWLTVLTPINNVLRSTGRDALLAFILQGLSSKPCNTIKTADDLYAHFLIDPLTEPPVQTSRIRLALSAVQLFIDRIIRSLEPCVSPGDVDPQQWQWMKRYRVWQANREVFLWPENWLDPQLRDDQSPIFQQVMSSLLQSDITDDAATSSYLDYLSDLADVAKLEPCGMYYVPASADADEIAYVVSRSFGAHRKYYFRQLKGGSWSPWNEVPIECEDMPLTPLVWNGRLFLFWLKIHKLSPMTPAAAMPAQTDSTKLVDANVNELLTAGPNTIVSTVTVQATLWWTEYYNGKWQSARSSDPNRPTTIQSFDPSGSNAFEAFRNQVRIVPATCTGAFLFSDRVSQPVTPPAIPESALILAISTPHNPFPVNGWFNTAGSGFLLHNTHSTPTPLEDMPMNTGNVGGYLDIPAPSRLIQPPYNPYQPPGTPYSGGAQEGSLTISYFSSMEQFENFQPEASPRLLDFHWLPRIVEVQPNLADIRPAPFLYEDRRNLFYVTTTISQSSIIRWGGFGVGWDTATVAPQTANIPPVKITTANLGRVAVTLPGVNPVAYQGTSILNTSGLPAAATIQTINSAR